MLNQELTNLNPEPETSSELPEDVAPTTGSVSLAFPEGGRDAWTCLLGSALMMFPSFGFQTAVGTVQDYISVHQLADYSVRDVGWITAILTFLTLFLGVQVGPLFDRYGPRVLLTCGSLASFLSYLLLAECSQYWQFILCLSILGGISAAVVTTVAISVLSHWFFRRRALASGICMAGSSAGGAILPLILRRCFGQYGWAWSLRIIALVALACYALGIFLVKGRLPASTQSGATIDLTVFRSPRLCFLAVAVFAFEFIIFGCASLLPTYVRYASLALDVQYYSLTVLNSMSLLGRVLPGLAADLFGRFNILLSLVVLTLLVMAAVWIPVGSHDEATLYTVVAIFGFGSGGWISLAPVCAGQLCRTEEYGRFYGTIYSVAAFGALLTVPVGGELLQKTTPQVLVGFYAAVLVVGLVSVVCSRWALLEWRWRWKVKV
ncbi:putative MFS monocarboxylate transporter [Aspergillus brunneoviolaceus CBS 621.78]|uniref:Monocarboxylate permease-like protein, mch4 n=1 Tax=Aspergillus brunneoviolaceus CBS 621.78 TaxID=1450534 RepID=A0ACD1GA76_9EURO|nr:monocarboxylate permease-like protein, mch4 [Aspergillus brunneoviolaceus CBS 621.78]RAH46068.1 monocarboxylate permease-like protein, mch4 [Aspergillus brunneoviolaceus CBS 621.78]